MAEENKEIGAFVDDAETVCEEAVAPANGIIVFGASGDLTLRKLLPSLYKLYKDELITENFYLLGCGRTEYTDSDYRQKSREALRKSGEAEEEKLNSFLEKIHYQSGDYGDLEFYEALESRMKELDGSHGVDDIHLFYLSTPPILYETIVTNLGKSNLSCKERKRAENTRLIIEKPFGRDYGSARQLDETLGKCFNESQIYRIDHYLGKETVQNILMFRFANTIFEPIWNRNYIDNVQITIAESVGVGYRAGYYEKSGALRDMFQNHMLQMLALVGMEPPVSFEADRVRDEKVKLLRSIRPIDINNWNRQIVRGQYGPGKIDGEEVPGYRQEDNIDENSRTETFVAAKLYVDNWRWRDVPFYLRTGKRLAAKKTEIAITFKKVPHTMFLAAGIEELPRNVLVLRIQPNEGISMSFQAKRPGSKLCMSTLNMEFDYNSIFKVKMPEAYQRLILDCMIGDQTLFNRYDAVELSWKLLDPVIQKWEQDSTAPEIYPAGSETFPLADSITVPDGVTWRTLK